jgi:aspartyl-tRNA(Asn)/glutamyl-tRNA(Gln) amidotransferase subunit C
MELTSQDIARIAHLARIELSENEIEPVRDRLRAVFGLIDDLQRVNTDNVTPMAHAQPLTLPLRADRVTEPETADARDALQTCAPEVEDGLFLVPKVIE